MSKKTKTLKRLNDKDLAKLVGGKKLEVQGKANAAAAAGSTWLYDCWEGTCTAYMKAQALKKATPAEKALLQKSTPASAAPARGNLKSE
jgi:hypothetical protein